jgi:hypothetical protein
MRERARANSKPPSLLKEGERKSVLRPHGRGRARARTREREDLLVWIDVLLCEGWHDAWWRGDERILRACGAGRVV